MTEFTNNTLNGEAIAVEEIGGGIFHPTLGYWVALTETEAADRRAAASEWAPVAADAAIVAGIGRALELGTMAVFEPSQESGAAGAEGDEESGQATYSLTDDNDPWQVEDNARRAASAARWQAAWDATATNEVAPAAGCEALGHMGGGTFCFRCDEPLHADDVRPVPSVVAIDAPPVALGRDTDSLGRNVFEAFMLDERRTYMMRVIHDAIRLGQCIERGDDDNATAWEDALTYALARIR